MAVVPVACAMARTQRTRFAALAGVASGLGLAIGIEALAFHAIAGASFALSAAVDQDEARPARAYGLALVAATLGFYVLQTPPGRWSLSVCDALGANLVGAILVAGLGLSAFGTWGARFGFWARLAQLAAIGALAAAVYIAANPACLHGPFAAVDPRLRPIWFDRINELESWPKLWRHHRDAALISIFMGVTGAAAAGVLLVVRWRRWDRATLLAAALVSVAAVAAAHAWRMEDYAFWFGIPTLAAAIGWLVGIAWSGAMVPAAAAALVLSPVMLAVLVDDGLSLIPSKPAAAAGKGAAPAKPEEGPFQRVFRDPRLWPSSHAAAGGGARRDRPRPVHPRPYPPQRPGRAVPSHVLGHMEGLRGAGRPDGGGARAAEGAERRLCSGLQAQSAAGAGRRLRRRSAPRPYAGLDRAARRAQPDHPDLQGQAAGRVKSATAALACSSRLGRRRRSVTGLERAARAATIASWPAALAGS